VCAGHAVAVAKRHHALIVFLEHRFFGSSLPFGPVDSYSPTASRIGLLSVEQALADYAAIISYLRDSKRAWDSPVITFGGSLAGTLSAFMRIKYPNIVDMAWASSAPLRGYPGLGIDQFAWREQVTKNFQALSPGCPDTVRHGFAALLAAAAIDVCSSFRVCGLKEPWHTQPFVCEAEHPDIVANIQPMAWGVLEGDGEFVYPPASSAIPRHCRLMANNSDGGTELGVFVRLLWQGSGEYISTNSHGDQCLNTTAFTSRQYTPDSKGWDYLSCTEIIHPIGANNITDFFPPGNWSLPQLRMYCSSKFGADHPPRPAWLPMEMGMSNLDHFSHSTSHIVFVYGLRDPWHTQAISLSDLSQDLPVVTIEDGGHCADMLVESNVDTLTMIAARNHTETILAEWIAQFDASKKSF